MAANLHLQSWFESGCVSYFECEDWSFSLILWIFVFIIFLRINDEICCDFMYVCVEMEGTDLIWAPFCECNQGNISCGKWNVIIGLSWIWFINFFGSWRCKLFYLSNIKTKEKNEGGVCPLWNFLWEKRIFA